jgi:hypothetical protein
LGVWVGGLTGLYKPISILSESRRSMVVVGHIDISSVRCSYQLREDRDKAEMEKSSEERVEKLQMLMKKMQVELETL